ncbi:MAG: TolC family protein [Polyangiaceae bacterium]
MSDRKSLSPALALALTVLGTSLPSLSNAQELAPAAEATGMLTSHQAVELAVQNNPELHTALLRESQARFNVTAEEAFYDPIFSANAGYTHSRSPSLRGTDGTVVSTSNIYNVGAGLTKNFAVGTALAATLTGQRSASASPPINNVGGQNAVGPAYSLVGRLALTQPLLRGYGSALGLASLRVARLNRTAEALQAQQVASQTLHDLLTAYWELWYSTQAVRIKEATRDLAKTLQTQAEEQVKSGVLANVDALPYYTQLASQEEAVVNQALNAQNGSITLARYLGQSERTGPDLTPADNPPDVVIDDLGDQALNDALAASYNLKQLQTQLQVAQVQTQIAGDPLRPRLDVDAYVQAQGLGNRAVSPAFDQFGSMDAVSAHVGFTFESPITDTRRSAQIQSALLSAHIAEKQIESARQDLRAAVRTALLRRNAAKRSLEVALQTEKVASQQAEGQKGKFLAGTAVAADVKQAEDAHQQAQLSVERARVDMVEGELDLLNLRGKLLERYADVLKSLTPNILTLPDAREPM